MRGGVVVEPTPTSLAVSNILTDAVSKILAGGLVAPSVIRVQYFDYARVVPAVRKSYRNGKRNSWPFDFEP